jgi:HEAT repeat protein
MRIPDEASTTILSSLPIAILAMTTDVSQLLAALGGPDPAERARAAERLSRLGPDAQAAAVPLVRASADVDEEVRQWATAALEELGPPALSDLQALAPLLDEENADVGYWAATLLGRLGEEAAPAVGPLAEALSAHPAISVRQRAAWALGKIGPPARAATDALRQAAAGDDPRLARLAQRAIQQIGG